MKPYYDDGQIIIYHGDCREIISHLNLDGVFLLTDPPYGISLKTNNHERKRGALTLSNDYIPVYDDDKPFDPAHLLSFERAVLFGANYYADKLPPSPSWIVWDKLDGLTSKRALGFNDSADVELAWTNLGGPARLISDRWMGSIKGTERQETRVHPTQKPVVLMKRIIEFWVKENETIFDPYMGSGSTLRAAKDLGRKAIGIEIEEKYCEIAIKRLAQGTLF
jgi:DNA modification methylase